VRILTQDISYRDQDVPLTGTLYEAERREAGNPGILPIHGGAGLDDHARDQARRYAAAGFTVFACDMLGDGVAGHRDRVVKCLTEMRDDPAMLARRGQAGLAVLAARPDVSERRAAIGYCFGGMAALELARAGAPLTSVVSIRGSLATKRPAGPGSVSAKVLACHGSADPHVPLTDVAAFAEEMNAAAADWQLIMYGRAMHGFTHRTAAPGGIPGVEYDAAAEERSFRAVRAFLAETLGQELARSPTVGQPARNGGREKPWRPRMPSAPGEVAPRGAGAAVSYHRWRWRARFLRKRLARRASARSLSGITAGRHQPVTHQ